MSIEIARNAWEAHWADCRTCGNGHGLCVKGARLHKAYATIKTRIEQGR